MRTHVNVVFSLLCWLLCSQLCSAKDTLKAGENITHTPETTLVSASSKFELGFISIPAESEKKYLGIWYQGLEPRTVVWVANRDNPVKDSTAVFQIGEDGNLVVADASQRNHWSSGVEGSSSNNRAVKLLDSGNLVLMENSTSGTTSYLWQSFHHPTDTFLPGMKMDANLTLTSWKNETDPGTGSFTFKLAQTGGSAKYVVNKDLQLYWAMEVLHSQATIPEVLKLLTNATSNSSHKVGKTVFNETAYNETSRLLMNSSGEIQFWKVEEKQWNMKWQEPSDPCYIHNHCGKFSSCNKNTTTSHRCKCLPGFSPMMSSDSQQHHLGELQSQGCERKPASCDNMDDFLKLNTIKVGNPDKWNNTETDDDCKSLCLNMCQDPQTQCQAYSYNTTYDRDSSGCEIWTRDLPYIIQEEHPDRDTRHLSILVKKSDIEPTPKSCEPCGTNTIPYPLSTGPNCGDPMYHNFSCTHLTGEVSFMMPGGKLHRVTWIDADARKFYIQMGVSDRCYPSSSFQNLTLPFNVTNWCSNSDETEISWQPAPEPPCRKAIDCDHWFYSTCKRTSNGETRCLCDSNYKWNDSIISCTKEESTRHHSTHRLALILPVILIGTTILACIIVFAIVRRRKIAHKLDKANTVIQESLNLSERHVKGLIGLGSLEEKDIEGVEVPCYTFASILAATDNFSDSNKLGQGGYGPVYKGRFHGGQDIAVKRLSSVSTQGLQEFKNEVVLISKLQHRNLVRLRGYCIKGDEKILLYEYMSNKSLDLFIFDRTRTLLLDWPMRFDIIVGIARGLLYLHQDSRLRVIHRDLKTSNILLDEDMNPKISDFGLAKIFGGKETEASTERVVGTYGYMAPEYALDGFFSIKSDVFSFGVVLLEILSGKKNTGFYQSKQISSLLGYVWKLWTENKLLELMDPSLGETCNENQFIKCALIGLLCVQDEPGDRPTMFNVLTMLDSETATIPIPLQPTFFVNKRFSSSASSSSKPETSLQFDSSYQEGR